MYQHLQSVHPVHPNIQNDNRNGMTHGITEEIFPSRKFTDADSNRFE